MMCFLLYYVLWLCASSRCRMQSLLLSSPIYPPFHCSRRPCPITRRSAVGRQRRRRRHRGASLVFHWWQRRPAAKIFQRTPPAEPSSLLVSIIFVVIAVLLPKCPSQSWLSVTSKKSRAFSQASASAPSSSSVVTPLPSSLSRSSRPMNNMLTLIAGIKVVVVGGLTAAAAATALPVVAAIKWRKVLVRQAEEEGVVQVASGVGAVASVALLLLCCRHRRCHPVVRLRCYHSRRVRQA